MCTACKKDQARSFRPKKTLFIIDCPNCKVSIEVKSVYMAWCSKCGCNIEIRDEKPIKFHTKEQLRIKD
jgi:hypothetical protein